MPEARADARLAAIAAIAAEAGRLALAYRASGYRRWEKAGGEPVCDADLAVDALLKARLGALDPAAGWLSEETADDPARLDRERVWVVDPIDGTRDYLRGRPGWAISIALVEHGRPVAAVLDAPAAGEVWTALAGGGAWRDGRPLTASTRAALAGARVPADALLHGDRDLVTVAKPNSIALRIAKVAADEADLVATLRWGHEWDIAAAVLIAAEAGAAATDALGAPLRFNTPAAAMFGVLVCAPAIHDAASDRLRARAGAAAPTA